MAVPNAAILWPIRFAASSYVLRASMGGAAAENLTFSVTANRDYWVAGDGQADGTEASDAGIGKGDLLVALKACLDSHTNAATATVSVNASGQIVVASSASTVQILWANGATTLDKTIFGFTGDTSAASSVTATNLPQGRWLPGRGVSEDSRDRQPIVGAVKKAISGKVRVDRLATPLKEREFFIRQFLQAKALNEYAAATDPYGAFEYAWTNSLSYGRPFRFYADDSAIATPTYSLYRAHSLEDPLTRNDQFKVWWDVRLAATKAF